MSESPQVLPAIRYAPGTFESHSNIASRAGGTTAILAPSILLVGRSASWGNSILKFLEKLGSELTFASPKNLAAEDVKKGGFDLVLFDSTVTPEERRQLASELTGSNVTIFYPFPVEKGCWWLPMLRRGQHCHGAPAFRRNEFPLELERILSGPTDA